MKNSVQRSLLQVLSILFEHRRLLHLYTIFNFKLRIFVRGGAKAAAPLTFSFSLHSDSGSSLIFFRGGSKTVG